MKFLYNANNYFSHTFKDHGAAGAYTTKFKQLDKELEEIREILRSASITQDELLDLQQKIDVISNRTTETTDQLDGYVVLIFNLKDL